MNPPALSHPEAAVSATAPAAAPPGGLCSNPLVGTEWPSALAGCHNESVFFQPAWAAVLAETYGYTPLYVSGAERAASMSLLPLMEVDSILTGRRGISLPFTDECQPVAADAAAFESLFNHALALGKTRRWKYLELRGGRRFLPDATASQQFYAHELDLGGEGEKRQQAAALQSAGGPGVSSEENRENPGINSCDSCDSWAPLFAGLKPSVRRAIRKAEKSGLTVQLTTELSAVREFYRLQCLTRRKHGLPPQPFRFFENLHRHILAQGRGLIAIARSGARPVAANLFLHTGRQAIYKFGASDPALQHLRGADLVMWAGIRHYAARGFTRLHLGRTSMANDGLRRFKLAWGARERLLEYFKYDLRSNQFVTARDEAFGWYNRIFSMMPLWAGRAVGAMLYRHVA